MTEKERFQRWHLKEDDLVDLTPSKARDLIVKCFFEAQKETFARAKQDLGIGKDKELMTSVVGSIKLAFKGVGEDFDNPTRASLLKVVDWLAKKAASWGTPPDIINYHKSQIQKIIGMLRD